MCKCMYRRQISQISLFVKMVSLYLLLMLANNEAGAQSVGGAAGARTPRLDCRPRPAPPPAQPKLAEHMSQRRGLDTGGILSHYSGELVLTERDELRLGG